MPTTKTPSAIVQGPGHTLGNTAPTTGTTTPGTGTGTPSGVVLTKFQFRKLFTMPERTLIDNLQYNTGFSGTVKAVVNTIMTDLNVSGEVNLQLADVIAGLGYLQSVGILTAARVARILSNQSPL